MNHLPSVSLEKTKAGKILSLKNCTATIYFSIDDVPTDWEVAAPRDNIFLQRPFPAALESAPPKKMRFGYLVFYKNEQPIGVAALQILPFNADKSLNDNEESKGSDACFFRTFGRYLKSLVASKVEFTTLVCGNLLLSGEHGFHFDYSKISLKNSFRLLQESLLFAQHTFEQIGMRSEVTFVKDYFFQKREDAHVLVEKGFNEFTVQPNMILNIDKNWQNFDDYLAAMNSKYRVRVRRAFKKAKDVEKILLDETVIWKYNDQLNALYENVVENAGFNLLQLHPDYFTSLKERLGDDFRITAYFYDDVLIGFYTTIKNGACLEAHFLGYKPAHNLEKQLYLNMLYDIIREGIDSRSSSIIFGRTAMEIKSSVGAAPFEMFCYIRHKNNFANRFMKPLLEYLKPDGDWIPRNPFKQ